MARFARPLVVLAGTALGIILLVVLLRSVDLGQLGNDFTSADGRYLALAIVPFAVNLGIKVPRWSLLFGEDAPGPDTLFGAMNVGYAVNALLPARLGEIVRAYWVRDRAGLSMVRVLSTIAVERVSDGVFLLVLLLSVAPTVPLPRFMMASALTIGAVFVAVLLAMSVTVTLGGRWRWVTGSGLVARTFGQAITGLQALQSKRAIVLLLLYTAVVWASNALVIWLVLRGFHIAIPFTGAVLLTAVLNLGMAVPSSPGYVGVFEELMVLTLALYGIGRTSALAAALALHAISFVPVTLIGLVYIARFGFEATAGMIRAGQGGSTPSPPM